MLKYTFFLILLISWYSLIGQTTISGTVTDGDTGEDLPYASIYVKGTNIGTETNEYGFYSLTIKAEALTGDKVTIVFSFFGYGEIEQELEVGTFHNINLELEPKVENIDEVVITAEKSRQEKELRSGDMSTTKLQMEQIKNLPSLGGEVDIIKVIQLLPGVQGGTEGSTGMFVRGGDADQNLVLLDEATVYNIGHLFGFFSVFNADAIRDMTMIKGGFPSNYGGRLSSILDIRMKDGHDNKIHGAGGIGLLSSRITLEGPILKNKASFLISARRTYIDKVLKLANLFVPYYFYDLNGKAQYKINDKNRLFYSIYYGKDVLAFDGQDVDDQSDPAEQDTSAADLGLGFGFNLANLTNTVRWNHIYGDKLFSNVSLISTAFNYDINGKLGSNNIAIRSNIFDLGAKADWDYFKNSDLKIKFGTSFISHVFKPNIVSTAGDVSEFLESSAGDKLYTQEFGVYAHADQDIMPLWKIKYGLRVSGSFLKGRTYAGLEPRFSTRYMLNNKTSIKASYSRMKQYMHRVSSSTVALPTDLWYPVTANIAPQISDQVAVGYNMLFEKIGTSLTIEGYYKWLQNLIEYREGANLILNNNFENELLQGNGDAWGGELLLQKNKGRFNGWISYTISWATRDFDELNGGRAFWAKYDRRHSISVVGNFDISKRITFSAVWVYQTGSRFTAQIGQYFMPNSTLTGLDIIPIYTDRNEVQMSPSHRLDLNLTIHSREKEKKFKSEWSFGCYNLYNQAQPYRVDIVPAAEGIGYQYQQPGLFGFIPSIAYNFKF
ncbi:MAG: hypothetical protein ACI9J3_001010 [Parvicellaceae bacterium]|jgi:hypothetical protein